MEKVFIFYKGCSLEITWRKAGFFDPRPRLHLDLYYFAFDLILPFRSKYDDFDPPKYGFSIHSNSLWVYLGGDNGNSQWDWSVPFVTKEMIRNSILLKDGRWEHETRGKLKRFWDTKWDSKKKVWKVDYKDYDGEVVPARITLNQREWRPKWLTWTSLFSKVVTYVEAEFEKEIGRKKGTWKGGVTGVSMIIDDGDDPVGRFNEFVKKYQ